MFNEAIYEDLKKNILHLDLKPGVMISEMELCEKYKVSRTPIRDVIKKLESEDLLEEYLIPFSFVCLSSWLYSENYLNITMV